MGREFNGIVLPAGIEVHRGKVRVTFTYNKKRYRESLGLLPTKTNFKFSAGKLATINHEIKMGTFNYASHFPNSKHALSSGKVSHSIRIGELISQYKSIKYSDLRESTIRKYDVSFKQCMNIIGEDRLMSSILPIDILKMRSELMIGRSAKTVNTYLTCFQTFLKFTEDNKYTNKPLSTQLKRVKDVGNEPDPLQLDEYQRVIAACRHEQHVNTIMLMTYTGLRSGEICPLAWEDIDLNKGKLRVRRATDSRNLLKTPKTDVEREVDLHPPAMEALKRQKALTYLLPPTKVKIELPDKTFRTEDLRFVFAPNIIEAKTKYPYLAKISLIRMWESVCKLAGIRYRRVYQLRHTYASWSLTAHGNVAYIANQLGHKDYTMLVRVYGRWMPSESKKESDRIWNELEAMGHNNEKLPPFCPQAKKRC